MFTATPTIKVECAIGTESRAVPCYCGMGPTDLIQTSDVVGWNNVGGMDET